MTKIYTKHGDRGQSSLVGGERVDKNHPRLNAYGTIDELCSHLGFVSALIDDDQTIFLSIKVSLTKIQNELFQVGSLLACANLEIKKKLPSLSESHIQYLETQIDLMEKDLPKLQNFIIPGGSLPAAYAHIARTVCRRAEREVFTLISETKEDNDNNEDNFIILKYINRLSDFIFVSTRWINFKSGIKDQIWRHV